MNLDKEADDGDHSVIIGVKCQRRNSTDPSVIIPVRLLVTDANDNSPEFIGAPYVANVSEVTVVGSVIAQNIRATDQDQPGPFSTVEYYVEPGAFSHLLRFTNPLEGSLVLMAPIDYESLPRFTVTIRAQDQGEPPNIATTTFTINVLDSDDQNPR